MHRLWKATIALILLAGIGATPALAVSPNEVLKDPKLEARARAMSGQLRCPRCQSESIDESNADIAKDLRLLVRERLVAGDTDDQIRAYLVSRYGEFILLKPSFGANTFLLWIAPFTLLAIGGFATWRLARRRTAVAASAATVPLDEAEKRRLDEALADPVANSGKKPG